MSVHCIVWYCIVLHCWLRRAGCISQDTYLLYNINCFRTSFKLWTVWGPVSNCEFLEQFGNCFRTSFKLWTVSGPVTECHFKLLQICYLLHLRLLNNWQVLDLIGFVSRLYPFLLWHNILGSLHACSPKYIHQIFTTEYWDLLMHVFLSLHICILVYQYIGISSCMFIVHQSIKYKV